MSLPASGPDAAHTILTVTDNPLDPGVELYTTAAPHDIIDTSNITVTGVSNAAYNVTAVVTVWSADTFTLSQGYVGDATGGQWEYA